MRIPTTLAVVFNSVRMGSFTPGDIVGCKLTVNVSQRDEIIADGFWPRYIQCRVWRRSQSPRDNKESYKSSYLGDDTVSRRVTLDSDR